MTPLWWSACHCVLATSLFVIVAQGLATLPRQQDGGLDELPKDFIVGAGTSAYQCEGAWNVSGKGEGLLDFLAHNFRLPPIATNADVAADSYHRYKEDVAAARQLKLQMYRFSLSWSRLLPTGHADFVNPDAIRYYNALIDEIIANGMQPMITLFHFDHPYSLQEEYGGFKDARMVEAFVEFAEVAFTHFGNRVKWWLTHNEPYMFCTTFYKAAVLPEAIKVGDGSDYACVHHLVLSHGRAYALYQQKFARTQKGKIGLTGISFAPRPNTTSYADVAAARRYNLFTLGTSFGPVVTGDYPAEVRYAVDTASRLEGRAQSRLHVFSPLQSAMLRGSADFLGVNIYYGQVVAAGPRPRNGTLLTDHTAELLTTDVRDPNHDHSRSFEDFTPWGMSEAMRWTWDEYHLPIFVTENGFITKRDGTSRELDDHLRAAYHSAYMRALLQTVHEDGVPVLGYLAWSLIDQFEYFNEMKNTFGLVHVDIASGSLNRTLKRASSAFFVQLADTRRVPLVLASSSAATGAPSVLVLLAVLVTSSLALTASSSSSSSGSR